MPIIDVSQNSYRALVKAAHKRGMSIDRFIQFKLALNAGSGESNVVTAGADGEGPTTPGRQPADKPTLRLVRERTRPEPVAGKADPQFDALWGRIEQSAGDEISTKRGQSFTYEVDSGYLTVRDSGARIPRSQFKKALNQWPQNGPSTMRGIYAPSVVWAVLADERIQENAA